MAILVRFALVSSSRHGAVKMGIPFISWNDVTNNISSRRVAEEIVARPKESFVDVQNLNVLESSKTEMNVG